MRKRETIISIRNLSIWFGKKQALNNVSLDLYDKEITAIIGASGCGKSTLLRSLNRMIDETAGVRIRKEGEIFFGGEDIMRKKDDIESIRARIGMVFQKPNPFQKSMYDNVAWVLKMHRFGETKRELDPLVERALKEAGLFNEIKDRLHENAYTLSGGQQQRLCIARAIAVKPEALLMDEPCSALDPIATAHIEDLIQKLKKEMAVIIVTHNIAQAARLSDRLVFMHFGEIIEKGRTKKIFSNPKDSRTQGYITGRFG
ncbi:phosphate ABC transporter ATP-binding protein PstB [bacterium]|nr:phosphate ABC transporter ATP-binding protein PstB [bacterium]